MFWIHMLLYTTLGRKIVSHTLQTVVSKSTIPSDIWLTYISSSTYKDCSWKLVLMELLQVISFHCALVSCDSLLHFSCLFLYRFAISSSHLLAVYYYYLYQSFLTNFGGLYLTEILTDFGQILDSKSYDQA